MGSARGNEALEFVLIVVMNRKRDRSPSLSPSACGDESTKLCLICEAMPVGQATPVGAVKRSCYYVFVLDSAEASADAGHSLTTNREPTLRLDGLDEVTFCVFKSTLFIFECETMSPVEKYERDLPLVDLDSDNFDKDYDMDLITSLYQRRSVYSFDLPQSDSSSKMIVVQKSDLLKLPDMHGVKVVPDAVVTPGGKILVFSTLITTDLYYYPDFIAPFELYDPDTKVWTKLPDIVLKYEDDLSVWVGGFLSNSRFFISTGHGNFVFNLDESGSGWNQHKLLPLNIEDFKYVGVVGGEDVCLTARHLKNARDWTTISVYPRLSRFPGDLLDCLRDENIGFFPRITQPIFGLVDTADADGCFSFCAAGVLIHRDSKRCPASLPYFIFDVFRGRPRDQLELSGSIKFCSDIGDFFDLNFWGVFRVCFNC